MQQGVKQNILSGLTRAAIAGVKVVSLKYSFVIMNISSLTPFFT